MTFLWFRVTSFDVGFSCDLCDFGWYCWAVVVISWDLVAF